MPNRSKKFIFVPFCLMAQAYQAQGIVKYEWKSSIKPIIELLLEKDINIIQMPCSEATFKGLVREPQGLKGYNTEKFNKHCEELAEQVYLQIKEIIDNGYQVVAVLGIEQSPSCTVNYIYTNKGNVKRMGLFIEKVHEKILEYEIPFIGVNRRSIKKAMESLKEIIGE